MHLRYSKLLGIRAALASAVVAFGAGSGIARAEASHHQGASAGQIAAAVNVAQFDSLTSTATEDWRVTLFPSYLRATRAFDDGGMSLRMPSDTRVESYTLNAYVERRIGERWAASVLTGWQEMRLREASGDRSVSSLTDSFIALRHFDRMKWGTLSAVATVKVPGTYPESTLTSTKQADGQVEVLASVELLPWLSIVGGGGYRARLGGVQDEVTATVLAPVRLAERITVTPSLLGAVPVGFGDVAKNAVTAGASVGWRVIHTMDVNAAYYRTVYGRNVVQADVLTFGAGAAF